MCLLVAIISVPPGNGDCARNAGEMRSTHTHRQPFLPRSDKAGLYSVHLGILSAWLIGDEFNYIEWKHLHVNAAVWRWVWAAEEAQSAHRAGTVAAVRVISAWTQARRWRESRQGFDADLPLLFYAAEGLSFTMAPSSERTAFHLNAILAPLSHAIINHCHYDFKMPAKITGRCFKWVKIQNIPINVK